MEKSPVDISIALGGGRWNRGHKRAVLPWMTAAVDLAKYGAEWLGYTIETPKKVTIWRVSARHEEAGASYDAEKCDIYIPYRDVKHRKVGRTINELALASSHELSHCIRNERFNAETLRELTVTEGIAYNSEYLVARELLSVRELEVAYGSFFEGVIGGVTPDDIAGFNDAVAFEDELTQGIRTATDTELFAFADHWQKETPRFGIDRCSAIGIYAVERAMESGATLTQIMQQPAVDVLAMAL